LIGISASNNKLPRKVAATAATTASSNNSNTSNNYNCCLKIKAQKSACGPLSPSWPSSFHAACNFASAEEPAEPEEATEDLGREGQSNQHTMQTTCLPKC